MTSSPFGTPTRTRVLLALAHRRRAHVRELARLTKCALSVVQNALRTLEADGMVRSVVENRSRFVTLNPDYPAHAELAAYLQRLLAHERAFAAHLATFDVAGPPAAD